MPALNLVSPKLDIGFDPAIGLGGAFLAYLDEAYAPVSLQDYAAAGEIKDSCGGVTLLTLATPATLHIVQQSFTPQQPLKFTILNGALKQLPAAEATANATVWGVKFAIPLAALQDFEQVWYEIRLVALDGSIKPFVKGWLRQKCGGC